MTDANPVHIIRSSERFHTNTAWLDSRHSFSFGPHYDAANTHHGLLLVSNDDVIRAGTGFSTHPHQDMEIVTWVLDGELEHRDSEGNKGVITPGLAQRMSAGRGIWHSEMNPSGTTDVRLVQMWVIPDTERIAPSYEQLDVSENLKRGGLIPIASGRKNHGAISIRQKDATLWAGRLRPAERVSVPDGAHVHLYVAKGRAALEGAGELREGDAARLSGAGGPALTAGEAGAEVLVWQTA